jgi:hypothetical protein
VVDTVILRGIAGNDGHMAGVGQRRIDGRHILGDQRPLQKRCDFRILISLIHVLREHGINAQNQ